MGTSVRRVLRLRTSPQSLVAAWFLARLPCGRRTWFPGPSRGSLLEPVWRFNLPLRARRNVRWGPWSPQRACPRTCSQTCPKVIPELGADVDGLWIHSSGRYGMGRLHRAPRRRAGRMGDATRRLQPPLAERPVPPDPADQGLPQRDLARPPAPRGGHGHPDRHPPAGRHPRPRSDQPAAADIALVATILFMLAAAVTGAADYTDTDGTARVRATLHSTLMVVALLLLLDLARSCAPARRPTGPSRSPCR